MGAAEALRPPRIGITLGDPRGIGPEVAADALRGIADDGAVRGGRAEYVVIGPEEAVPPALSGLPGVEVSPLGLGTSGDREAGRASARAVEHGIELAMAGRIDGLVTGPISKRALATAGFPWPGHTEMLRDGTGVPDVAMIMGAETTPFGGPLRIALLTIHVPLRTAPDMLTVELVRRRSAIAAKALRDWWGIARPRLAFAGVNPHASEGGLFGDEEERVIAPAMRRLEEEERIEIVGLHPADSVFRRCIGGEADLVVTPVHDVGLAVLKTLAPYEGINVTAGLPFPRTSPDHGTAFDIAGRGIADSRSMRAAIEACVKFCINARGSGDAA